MWKWKIKIADIETAPNAEFVGSDIVAHERSKRKVKYYLRYFMYVFLKGTKLKYVVNFSTGEPVKIGTNTAQNIWRWRKYLLRLWE